MRESAGAAALRKRLDRDPKPLTRAAIAKEFGLTHAAVSAWTRGISKPDVDKRARLEALTGVPASAWDDEADESAVPSTRTG